MQPAVDDESFFAPVAIRDFSLVEPAGERQLILWPDDRNVYLLIDCDFRDAQGRPMLPVVELQYQSWTDSLVTDWLDLSLEAGEYFVSRDTVIVVPERVRHVGLDGGMLNFRARLESRGFHTGWVRLSAAIQFYPARERGVPKQPAFFKLVQ